MLKKIIESLSKKQVNQIHLPDDNLKILGNLRDNNCRLLIKTDNNQQVFQSIIVSFNKLNNTLVIDELFPKATFKIKKQTLFYCEFHEKGSVTSFTTRFIDRTQSSGMPAFLMEYPSDVKYDQRRNNFRLALKPGQNSSAKLSPDYQPSLSGMIKDISNHGLRINIHGNTNDSIKKGDILQSCQIKLDESRSIQCQLTIRSKHYFNHPYRHTQIGTEITEIQLSDRKSLSNYVNQQQRQQCRLRATGRL